MSTDRTPISFIATSSDPDATQVFYESVLGLTLQEKSPYALVFRDCGQQLRIQIVPNAPPVAYTVHGWQVADIKSEISRLATKGVHVVRFDTLAQDAKGIWTTPDGHQVAWFKDPSGNTLSLTQFQEG